MYVFRCCAKIYYFCGAMSNETTIVCSGIRLCPHKYVISSDASGFMASDNTMVISIRGNARAKLQRHVSHNDGMMTEEVQVTLSFDKPADTVPLRNRNLHWWVAELDTADGGILLMGSKAFPCRIETDGTDTDDTITLTTQRPL